MKTTAELRFCDKNYGRAYALLFRIAMVLNATARLTLLATLRLFAMPQRGNVRLNSSWAKWRAILRTLLARRGEKAEGPVPPDSIPNCGAPNL